MPNTAKQEAIRKAYGEYWDRLSEFQKEFALNHNGAVHIGYSDSEKLLFKNMYKSGLFDNQPTRPKSLQGIENNNRWIRIESEEQHDEIENDYYWWYNVDNGDWEIGDKSFYGKYTHYQPIVKPEKPIY